MKGVLIGSDYLEHGNQVKILEINTNASMFNDGVEMLDFTPLFNTLIQNNITELHYIFTEEVSAVPVGDGNKFIDKLQSLCSQNGITFYEYQVQRNSVTVPYIEDDSNKFILRQAYDTYAILDSTYTSDKFGFFSLMSGSSFIPKTYYSSSEDQLFLDSLDSVDFNRFEHPTLVEKDRYPSYNVTEYPKISNVQDSDELSVRKQILTETPNNFLQEFIYDDKNVVDGYYSVIRSFDIIYGSELDIINMGGYRHSALVPLSFCENQFLENTNTLDSKTRTKYINKNLDKEPPVYHTDLESVILMSDESLLRVDNINEGDTIKTVTFDHFNSLSDTPWSETSSLEITSQSLQYVSSSLISSYFQELDTLMIESTLDTGEKSIDSLTTAYYIEESGSLNTRFMPVNRLLVGDKIIILDKTTNELFTKEITNIEIVFKEKIQIYGLDFEPNDYFLVDKGNNTFSIMHNRCDGCAWSACGTFWCDSFCNQCRQGPQK
jgi:hypothetical protein